MRRTSSSSWESNQSGPDSHVQQAQILASPNFELKTAKNLMKIPVNVLIRKTQTVQKLEFDLQNSTGLQSQQCMHAWNHIQNLGFNR